MKITLKSLEYEVPHGVPEADLWHISPSTGVTDFGYERMRELESQPSRPSDLIQILSPIIIADNLGMSREHASRRLAELTDKGYVNKLEDGKYGLSETGRSFLTEYPHSQ